MTTSIFARIRAFAGAIGGAFYSVGLIDDRRAPREKDLKAMGIDPAEYKKLGRRI